MVARARQNRRYLREHRSADGLYGIGVNVNLAASEKQFEKNAQFGLDWNSNAFYRALLLSAIQSNGSDSEGLAMYSEAVEANVRMDLFKVMRSTTGQSHLYHRSYNTKTHLHNFGMDESGCLLGALFALGAQELMRVNSPKHTLHWQLAVNITETCFQSYNRTPTKLGPESFFFDDEDDATNRNGDMYILR